jgi:hypothetical protein
VSGYENGSVGCNNAHLAHANGDWNAVEFFVESDHEPRIHGGYQEVKHPVIFIEYD